MTSNRYKRRIIRSKLLALAHQRPDEFWVDSFSKRKAYLRIGNLRVVLRKTDPLLDIIRRIRAQHAEAAIKRAALIYKSNEGNGKTQQKALRVIREVIRKYRCFVFTQEDVARLRRLNPRLIPLDREIASRVFGDNRHYYLYIL
ncbi:MAG: hypothetical protein ACFFCO_05235 [Promethearchaeota archaeon]